MDNDKLCQINENNNKSYRDYHKYSLNKDVQRQEISFDKLPQYHDKDSIKIYMKFQLISYNIQELIVCSLSIFSRAYENILKYLHIHLTIVSIVELLNIDCHPQNKSYQ
jgi:hypothetical protein